LSEPEPAPPTSQQRRSGVFLGSIDERDVAAPRTALAPPQQGWSQEVVGDAAAARVAETSAPPPLALKDAEDPDLNAALEMSMLDQQEGLAPSPESVRRPGFSCGLLNIGNTCYVNSFLQTLLHIDQFRERILRYRTSEELASTSGSDCTKGVSEPTTKRVQIVTEPEAEDRIVTDGSGAETGIKREIALAQRRGHCTRLACELRHLVAYSLFTDRSCIDPSRLLSELVDQHGRKVPIGGQEDVGEFMLKLLEQLDEGLRAGRFVEPEEQLAAQQPPATSSEERPAEINEGDGGQPQDGCEAMTEATAGSKVDTVAPGSSQADDVTKDKVSGIGGSNNTGDNASGKQPSLLQTLLFGEQVQILTYTETPKQEKVVTDEPTEEKPIVDDPTKKPIASPDPAPPEDRHQEETPGPPELAPQVGKEGKLVVNETKSDFLQIYLDMKHRDLYRAWEEANNTEMDYTTPKGSTTKATTSVWIQRLPKFLFFQLNRVGFDQEKKAPLKLDGSFDFDSTVYADRFLLRNRERAIQVAARRSELQRRHDELAEALSRFEAYQGRPGLAIEEVLGWVADSLEDNARETAAPSDPQPLGDSHPHAIAAAAASEDLSAQLRDIAPSAAQLLRRMRDSCAERVALLRAQLDSLTEEINAVYSDLRQHPYQLYAIWVHQGIAGSGHYLAYLRDWRNDRWIRLDDALVSVVEWEDVHALAVGQEGSNTSAYILVYVDSRFVEEHEQPRDEDAARASAERALPPELIREIHLDNEALRKEQLQREAQLADKELRRHAEAIFQYYAGRLHNWEPLKRTGDNAGNPHDNSSRKYLNDPALIRFELFLYRMHAEHEVWTYFLTQSIDAQRKVREWAEEDEGRILFFVAGTLRHHKRYASMLREKTGPSSRHAAECELVPLNMAKLELQYNQVLTQAFIIDEAIRALKEDRTQLVKTIGMLALLWAKWNLEVDDRFRQNEVLLVMSALIYNTIGALEKSKSRIPDASLTIFQPACEYFMLLLLAVEWPKSWKAPVIARTEKLFPQLVPSMSKQWGKEALARDSSGCLQHPLPLAEQKTAILQHPFTQANADLDNFEAQRPEPSQEFFDSHRNLYGWVMQNDEAIAQEFVHCQDPSLAFRNEPQRGSTWVGGDNNNN